MTTSHQKEQAERIAYAGSTTGMTYHSRAITGLDLERSGRHAQHATVIGSKPACRLSPHARRLALAGPT